MRCSLQRTKDLKIFRGWLEGLYYPNCLIRMAAEGVVLPGDSFQVQVHGLERDMIFKADLIGHQTDWTRPDFGILGSDDQSGEIGFEFKMKIGIAYAKPAEQARRAVSGVTGQFYYLDCWHTANIVDVGVSGIGFLSPTALPSGEVIGLAVTSAERTCNITATVRHCRPASFAPGKWRVGAIVEEMERLDKMAWNNLLGTQARNLRPSA